MPESQTTRRIQPGVLTLATLAATALVLGQIDWSGPWLPPTEGWDATAASP